MNPTHQDIKALLVMLSKILKLDDKVVGADFGLQHFQFDFDSEDDIEEVLRMQPYQFDYWMISLVRWKPVVEPNYPSVSTFWIRALGVLLMQKL